MTKKEHLLGHLKTVHGSIRKLVDDISEEEAIVCLPGNPNHIKFLVGHISTTAAFALTVAGVKPDYPGEWMKMFARGATVTADISVYPSIADIRTRLYALHAALEEFVATCDEGALERVNVIRPGWDENAMDGVLFFAAHDFYHAGQIAMIRRALGRDRMFG
ncbi:MAG: DinB family protein [Candidatus Zixiibacteriota bacterium]